MSEATISADKRKEWASDLLVRLTMGAELNCRVSPATTEVGWVILHSSLVEEIRLFLASVDEEEGHQAITVHVKNPRRMFCLSG